MLRTSSQSSAKKAIADMSVEYHLYILHWRHSRPRVNSSVMNNALQVKMQAPWSQSAAYSIKQPEVSRQYHLFNMIIDNLNHRSLLPNSTV